MKTKKKDEIPSIYLSSSGTSIKFTKAPAKDCIPYLTFWDGCGHYLGTLDQNFDKKDLKKLKLWVDHCLKPERK